jgi:hypothetical protein
LLAKILEIVSARRGQADPCYDDSLLITIHDG